MAKIDRRKKYRYSEGLAAHRPQSVIFKGLRFYPDGGSALSIAIFEYGGALFSLMPGVKSKSDTKPTIFAGQTSKSNHFKIMLRSTGSI